MTPPPPPPGTQVPLEPLGVDQQLRNGVFSLKDASGLSRQPASLTAKINGKEQPTSTTRCPSTCFTLYRLQTDPKDPTGSTMTLSDPMAPTQNVIQADEQLATPNPDLMQLILDAFRNPKGPESEPGQAHSASDSAGRRLLARRLHLPHADGDGNPKCAYALPAFLLYDARGLQLFDQLTRLPGDEYYLTSHEAALLADGGVANALADSVVQPGSVVVELGCGSMRKTKVILDAIELAVTQRGLAKQFAANPVRFFALDLDKGELETSLSELVASPPSPQGWQFLTFHGIIGTYTDLQSALLTCPALRPTSAQASRLILWLGSSIGNLTRAHTVAFLSALRQALPLPGDRMLLGVDGRNAPAKIERAYNDSHGVTREFELNILHHVNQHMHPETQLPVDLFEYAGVYNEVEGRHEAYLRALGDVDVMLRGSNQDQQAQVRVRMAEGDLLHIKHSYKYNETDVARLVGASRWGLDVSWTDGVYSLHLLHPVADTAKGGFVFDPMAAASQAVPPVHEWEQVWNAFDCVSLKLVKQEAWELRPIEVRLPVCFYVGHLPCFADVQLARVLGLPLLAPGHFARIFERGMDPDLDDPTQCHPHSEVPDSWPAMPAICAYRDLVRDRIRGLVTHNNLTPEIRSVLCLIFEHDAMHLETLMYMLAQFPPDLLHDPVKVGLPMAKQDAVHAAAATEPARTITLPATSVTLGRERDGAAAFGWDNEFPAHDTQVVGPLQVQSRPVSVSEYAAFLASQSNAPHLVPAGWTWRDNTWHVRSIAHNAYLHVARNEQRVAQWPVCVSRTMAQAYADWWNQQRTAAGAAAWRLPTEHELRRVYDTCAFDAATTGFAGGRLAPSPMRTDADTLVGAGNVWEWTATRFTAHPGFEPDARYPGYSADFFDDKHSVVLGASWATHPRLAARRTFRNWYQDGYTFAQVGFRLVRN